MTTPIDFPSVLSRLDTYLSRGLCSKIGSPDAQMCIESAITVATGEPFSDDPACVEPAVRAYSICLNDANWSSPKARAAGLGALAKAQIGSRGVVDGTEFGKRLAEKQIRIMLPRLFRAVVPDNPACLAAADRCEREGTAESAERAAGAAWAAGAAGAAWAARAARAAGVAGVAWAAERAAESAGWAAESAERAAGAAGAAESAGAAGAAWAAESAGVVAARGDEYLILSASLAVETLRELKSPGCAFLPEEGTL